MDPIIHVPSYSVKMFQLPSTILVMPNLPKFGGGSKSPGLGFSRFRIKFSNGNLILRSWLIWGELYVEPSDEASSQINQQNYIEQQLLNRVRLVAACSAAENTLLPPILLHMLRSALLSYLCKPPCTVRRISVAIRLFCSPVRIAAHRNFILSPP